MSLPVPGDTSPADFVGAMGDLADRVDVVGSVPGARGPDGPAGASPPFWIGTQAAYDALTPEAGVLYLISG
jgi:hypothetical protein